MPYAGPILGKANDFSVFELRVGWDIMSDTGPGAGPSTLDGLPPAGDEILTPDHETDTGFLVALWASVQRPPEGQAKGHLEPSPSELLQVTGCLRNIDQKLHNFRALFQSQGLVAPSKDQMEMELTELLQAICFLLSQYPALNSSTIQAATTSLVTKINGLHYRVSSSENRKRYSEIFRGLDALEICLGNETVEMFLGEISSNTQGEPAAPSEELLSYESLSIPEAKPPMNISVEEADEVLVKCEGGVDASLEYAKRWCKYTKELLSWMDKRISCEIDFAKNITKIAEAGKWAINQQDCMPLQYIYTMVMEHDVKVCNSAIEIGGLLQLKKYLQPLAAKKNEVEKWRKEFREQWQKEQKRMNDAFTSMRKSQAYYTQRCEDLEKAKQLSAKVEEEYYQSLGGNPGSSSKQMERRRRSQEDAQVKAQEAEASYRTSVSEANTRRQDMEKAKERIVSHVRKMIYQGDQVLKQVTLNFFRLQQRQAEKIPTGYQSLVDNCEPYDVGEKYLAFIQRLPRKEVPIEVFEFEEFLPSGKRSPPGVRRRNHGQMVHVSSGDDLSTSSEDTAKPLAANSDSNVRKSFGSDTESIGGSSESRSLDSPTSSPGLFFRKLPKAASTGAVSSDELDEKDSPQAFENELNDGTSENGLISGPSRNIALSSAALTHRLRRLRGPSKCRECDTFMVSGVECEECSLACHKKCLEGLFITCGHKKLPSRIPLFGIDFNQVYRDFPEEVPFIIIKCTSEIENRAIGVQGIYRISGSKARVEKLCQAFENGRNLVELSDHSPHDITSVLKHFLKELPESVVPYRLYDEFLALARDLQRTGEISQTNGGGREARLQPNPIQGMKDILCKLPATNYNTLRHIIAHLYRVAERFEENKMSSNNLGIIFGPTLIRPSPGNDISMTCLIDSGYQAQIIEFLVMNYERIFGMDELPMTSSFGCESSLQEACTEVNKDPSSPENSKPLPSESSSMKCDSGQCTVAGEAANAKNPETAQLVLMSTDALEPHTPAHPDARDPEVPTQERPEAGLEEVVGTQSRGHFSRQPVRASRQGPIIIRSVTHSVTSLPGNASAFYTVAELRDLEKAHQTWTL